MDSGLDATYGFAHLRSRLDSDVRIPAVPRVRADTPLHLRLVTRSRGGGGVADGGLGRTQGHPVSGMGSHPTYDILRTLVAAAPCLPKLAGGRSHRALRAGLRVPTALVVRGVRVVVSDEPVRIPVRVASGVGRCLGNPMSRVLGALHAAARRLTRLRDGRTAGD